MENENKKNKIKIQRLRLDVCKYLLVYSTSYFSNVFILIFYFFCLFLSINLLEILNDRY